MGRMHENFDADYANLSTSVFDFDSTVGSSYGTMREYAKQDVEWLASLYKQNKKEDNMTSVNVDDLWLVFPELTRNSKTVSQERLASEFANDVRSAADLVRMQNATRDLREPFEEKTTDNAIDGIYADGGRIEFGDVKEEI